MYTGVVRANDGVFSDQIQGARERQEDAVTYRSFDDGESLLLVLADGMGGHQGGEIASRTSVDAFVSAFFTEWSHVKTSFRLFGSLNRANKDLEVIGKKNAELEGMGSTLLAAVLSRDGISWISVGDSLLLRVRAGKVKRLNEDHSMVPLLEEAVKKGKLTSEEAATHKDRNALRSAVSGAPLELVDVAEEPESLRRGDVVILASDGLLTLTEKEIANVVSAHMSNGAQAIVRKLLGAVSEKNKRRQDNTTIAAVLIERTSTGGSKVRGNSARSWVLALGATVTSFLVGLGLGSSFLMIRPSQDVLSTVTDSVRGFEIPKVGNELTGSSDPQPVDIPDLITQNGGASTGTSVTQSPPSVTAERSNRNAEKGASPSSNKRANEKSNSIGADDVGSPPPSESRKEDADTASTDVTPKPTPPSEELQQKIAETVESTRKSSGDPVNDGAKDLAESKASESAPAVMNGPPSNPTAPELDKNVLTRGSHSSISPASPRIEKANEKKD
jgi:serine/threonine protein phosphatase PrpC